MVAAVATGVSADMESCIERWVTPTLGEMIDPNPALVQRYDRLFPAYVASRQASVPVWHAMRAAYGDEQHGGIPAVPAARPTGKSSSTADRATEKTNVKEDAL